MANYMCRLMDNEGTVRGVVPIIGSNEADAILIARHRLKTSGIQGRFELWRGNIRVIAQGVAATDGTVEGEEKTPVPQIPGIAAPPY